VTTTATKRKTTARKPAKARASNGQTNGHANVPVVRPPEEHVPREPETEPAASAPAPGVIPDHPYGDRMIQVFFPSEGEPIVVPHISTVQVTELFLWENHRQGLDLMQQSWRWMDLAEIPDVVQRQVVALERTDKKMFWEQWFAGYSPPATGEPPGES
jgi:hypothetical protein